MYQGVFRKELYLCAFSEFRRSLIMSQFYTSKCVFLSTFVRFYLQLLGSKHELIIIVFPLSSSRLNCRQWKWGTLRFDRWRIENTGGESASRLIIYFPRSYTWKFKSIIACSIIAKGCKFVVVGSVLIGFLGECFLHVRCALGCGRTNLLFLLLYLDSMSFAKCICTEAR